MCSIRHAVDVCALHHQAVVNRLSACQAPHVADVSSCHIAYQLLNNYLHSPWSTPQFCNYLIMTECPCVVQESREELIADVDELKKKISGDKV